MYSDSKHLFFYYFFVYFLTKAFYLKFFFSRSHPRESHLIG